MIKSFLRRGLFLAGLLTALSAPPALANDPSDLSARDLTDITIQDEHWATGYVFTCYVVDTEIDNNTITCHPFFSYKKVTGEVERDEDGNPILDEDGNEIPIYENKNYPHRSWNDRQHLKMTGKKIKINDKWCAIYKIVINWGDKKYYVDDQYNYDGTHLFYWGAPIEDFNLLFVKEKDRNNDYFQTPDMKMVDGGYYDLNNNGALIENIEDYEIVDFEESDNVHPCTIYFYDYPKRDFHWTSEYPVRTRLHIWGNDGDLRPWDLRESMERMGEYKYSYSSYGIDYHYWNNHLIYVKDDYLPALKYDFYYVGDGPTKFTFTHQDEYTGEQDAGWSYNMEFVNGGAYSYNGWGNIVPVIENPEIVNTYPSHYGLTVYLIDTDAWGGSANFSFNEIYGDNYGSYKGYSAYQDGDFADKYVKLNGHWYPIYRFYVSGGGKLETIQPVNNQWGQKSKKTRRRGGLYEFQENGVYYFAGQDVKAPVFDINDLEVVDRADIPAGELWEDATPEQIAANKKPGRVYVNLGANQLMQEGLWEQPYCYLHKRPTARTYYDPHDDYMYGSYEAEDYDYKWDEENLTWVTTPINTYYADYFNQNYSMQGMMDWYSRFTIPENADRIHEGEMTQVTLEDGTPVPGMYYYDVDDLNAYNDVVFYYYTHRYADDPTSYMVTALHPACRSDYFNPTEWADYIFDIGTDCVHQSYLKWDDYKEILNTPLSEAKTIYLAGNEAVSGGIPHSGDDPIFSTAVEADKGLGDTTYPVFFHKINVQTDSPAVFKISTINVPELAENLDYPEMYNFQRGWASFNLGIVGCDVKIAGEPTAPAEPAEPAEPAYETLRETTDPGEWTKTDPEFDYETYGYDPGIFDEQEPQEPVQPVFDGQDPGPEPEFNTPEPIESDYIHGSEPSQPAEQIPMEPVYPGDDASEEDMAEYDLAKAEYDRISALWTKYYEDKAIYDEEVAAFNEAKALYDQTFAKYQNDLSEWTILNERYNSDLAQFNQEMTQYEHEYLTWESEHATWVTEKNAHDEKKATWDAAWAEFMTEKNQYAQEYSNWFTAKKKFEADTQWNEQATARNDEKKAEYERQLAAYQAYLAEYPALKEAYEDKMEEWSEYRTWYDKHIVPGSPSRQVRYITNETLGYNRYCQYPWRVETMEETPDNRHGVKEGGDYWFVIDFQTFEPTEDQLKDENFDPASLVNETVTLLDINPHPEVTASDIKIVRIVNIPTDIADAIMDSDAYRDLRDKVHGKVYFDKLNFAAGSVRVNGLDKALLEDPQYDYEVQYTVWLNGRELKQKFDDKPSYIRINYMALRDKDDIAVRARYHDKSTGRYFSTMFTRGNIEIPQVAADLQVEKITNQFIQIDQEVAAVNDTDVETTGPETQTTHRMGCGFDIELDATPRDNVACYADIKISEFLLNDQDITEDVNLELVHSNHHIISNNLWSSYLGQKNNEDDVDTPWTPYTEEDATNGVKYLQNVHNWSDMMVAKRRVPAFVDNVITDYNPKDHDESTVKMTVSVQTIYPFLINVEEKELVVETGEKEDPVTPEVPADAPKRTLPNFSWDNVQAGVDLNYEDTDLPQTPEEFNEKFEMQQIGEEQPQPVEFYDEPLHPSGIVDVIVDAEVEGFDANLPVEVFTISGMRVSAENLQPGIYIVRQGQKVTKVHVK